MPSWVPDADASAFPLHHLPLGVRQRPDGTHAICARIGDYVADLRVLAEIGLFDDCGTARADFQASGLNALIARGSEVCERVRRRLRQALDAAPTYFDLRERREIFLLPQKQVTLVPPVRVGDYARVRSGAYAHARASSLRWGDAEVRGTEAQPAFGFVVGEGTAGGDALAKADADRYVFGVTAVLGFRESGTVAYPLPGSTVVSPWVTPLSALPAETAAAEASTLTPELRLTPALRLTPYRRGARSVEMPAYASTAANPAVAVATLTTDGARLRSGDLIVWNASARFYGDLHPGDAVAFTVDVASAEGAFALATTHATIVAAAKG